MSNVHTSKFSSVSNDYYRSEGGDISVLIARCEWVGGVRLRGERA